MEVKCRREDPSRRSQGPLTLSDDQESLHPVVDRALEAIGACRAVSVSPDPPGLRRGADIIPIPSEHPGIEQRRGISQRASGSSIARVADHLKGLVTRLLTEIRNRSRSDSHIARAAVETEWE